MLSDELRTEFGHIWTLSNTGRQLEPRGVGGKEREIYEQGRPSYIVGGDERSFGWCHLT